ALTTSQLDKVKNLSHVSALTETLDDRQSTTGSSAPSFGRFGSDDSSNSTTTSLSSPVTLNSDGPGRFFAGGGASSDTTATFSLPVSFLGTNNPSSVQGTTISLKSGKAITGSTDTNDALISGAMADKNGLKVGDTFTAYNATL